MIRTCHGQRIEVGSQVAYAWWGVTRNEKHSLIRVPVLKVAKVVRIERMAAEEVADRFDLVLDNGDTVECHDVAVTDGDFIALFREHCR